MCRPQKLSSKDFFARRPPLELAKTLCYRLEAQVLLFTFLRSQNSIMVHDRSPTNHQPKATRLRLPALLRRSSKQIDGDSIRSFQTISPTQSLSSPGSPYSSTLVQNSAQFPGELPASVQREKAGLWEWPADKNDPDAI